MRHAQDGCTRLGYTVAHRGEGTDALLSGVAEDLVARGLNVAGCVQHNMPIPETNRCDMVVITLPRQRRFQISQDRGPGARGCRLDAGALEEAVADVEVSLSAELDILIINKFGKHEASGRGFAPVIAEALGMGIPTLVGVSPLNQASFDIYAAGLGIGVEPTSAALLRWSLAAIAESRPPSRAATHFPR